MILAIVNSSTNIVENVIVPPENGSQWAAPDGYLAVSTDSAKIGDAYTMGVFITPDPIETDFGYISPINKG